MILPGLLFIAAGLALVVRSDKGAKLLAKLAMQLGVPKQRAHLDVRVVALLGLLLLYLGLVYVAHRW